MTNERRFAVLILTHGRADRVLTYKMLRDQGYTGRIIVVIDNTDKQADEYRRRFGSELVVFDKAKAATITDSMDNFHNMKAVVYARNAAWDIARDAGLTHFLVLDDDYSMMGYTLTNKMEFLGVVKKPKNLQRCFDSTLDYLDQSGAYAIAWAQGGDFIGGGGAQMVRDGLKAHRKIMNSFFLRTDRRFDYPGSINEDTTAYVTHGARGMLFLTFGGMRLWQHETQTNAGGLTDIYLQLGTYVKSFYTVMGAPSCCRVTTMGKHRRLHHSVSWNHAVPKIIGEEHRKPRRATGVAP